MMGATICLYKSSTLGFDLDTKRPWFQDQAAADAFMSGRASQTFRSGNFNKIGDDMIVPLTYSEAAFHDIGTITLETGPNQMDGTVYWFRVRDVFVNETNRTQIVYDIDYLQTFGYWMKQGHVDRVPKGSFHARGVTMNPKKWDYSASVPLFRYGVQVALVLKQMKKDKQNYTTGPFYIIMSCQWMKYNQGQLIYTNPINELSALGYFAVSDIVNAWVLPGILHSTNPPTSGNMQHWNDLSFPAQGTPFYWAKYTDATPLANFDASVIAQNVPDIMKTGQQHTDPDGTNARDYLHGTDSQKGWLSGVCDERGNILFTFKDQVPVYNDFYVGVRMSMASCEVDIVLNGRDNGYITGHTTDMMFTYSCRPIDVIADSWQDYLFRQRDADIQNRKLQNEAGLVGGVGNAGSAALTGALMGSIVPGIGTAAGAVAGGITSIVGSAVNYGVQSVYGDKMQKVTDRTYQLAQDTVAVNGMITTYQLALQQTLFLFQLKVDTAEALELGALMAVVGLPVDFYTTDMVLEMSTEFDDTHWRPWAGTCEVDTAIPSSWKHAISAQLAAGARYKKFGTWT